MIDLRRACELLSKKEVVIDVFDGFFGTQLLDSPMALSRPAEINVLASTLASKKIWKKKNIFKFCVCFSPGFHRQIV